MKKLISITTVFLSLIIAFPVLFSVTLNAPTAAPALTEAETETYEPEEAMTDAETEPETVSVTEPGPEETVSETEPRYVTEYGTDAGEDEEKYYGAVTAARTEEKTEPQTEPETDPETEPETQTEPETEAQTEPETEAKTEPETTAKPPVNGSNGYKGCDAEYIRVYNSQEKKYMNMLLGDYIVCVVAGEMPSRFSVEALKSQAVACRSFTLFRSAKDSCYYASAHGEKGADVCTNSGHCQAYLTYEAALGRWHSKSYTDERFDKIRQAVIETSGIVAAYDGKPIEALYHAASYGYTENYNNNWGGKRPYLIAVETPETLETAHVVSTDTFSSAEVAKILKKYGDPVFPEDKNEWFRLVPNDSGRVGKSDICGIYLTGQQMRGAFGLASQKFTVSYDAEKDEFTFDVRGWGHGVGLSQYGAGIYADMGYTYDQIIKHYYTGVELILWK